MRPAGYKPAAPASDRPQTLALDCPVHLRINAPNEILHTVFVTGRSGGHTVTQIHE